MFDVLFEWPLKTGFTVLYSRDDINSFPACSYFCCLPITFANSLDPDKYGHTVRSDLDHKTFVTLIVFENFLKNVNFDKVRWQLK